MVVQSVEKAIHYLNGHFPLDAERRIKHLWSTEDEHRFRINYFNDGRITRSYFVVVDVNEKEIKHKVIDN